MTMVIGHNNRAFEVNQTENHSGGADSDSLQQFSIYLSSTRSYAFSHTHILSQRGLRGLPIAWKLPINNESPNTLSDSHCSTALQSSVFFTSAPSTTLPGCIFSDKTPQGRWVLTKVTHASATFKANHNSMFHLKGCFTNFVFFFFF